MLHAAAMGAKRTALAVIRAGGVRAASAIALLPFELYALAGCTACTALLPLLAFVSSSRGPMGSSVGACLPMYGGVRDSLWARATCLAADSSTPNGTFSRVHRLTLLHVRSGFAFDL